MTKRFDIPESLLREMYVERGMTQAEIAAHFECSLWVVSDRLRVCNIPTRTAGDYTRIEIPRDVLCDLYVERGMSQSEIAAELGTSPATIVKLMHQYDIEARGQNDYASLQTTGDLALPQTDEATEQTEPLTLQRCLWHGCTNVLTGRQRRFCSKRCKNKYYVAKRRSKLKELSVAYKGGKCVVCGYARCIDALTFHHIGGQKEFGIGAKGYTRSWAAIREELDKCILVCSNCHAEIHAGLHFSTDQM